MTEYQICGLLFFVFIAIVVLPFAIKYIVCKRQNKRDLQKAIKVYDRMKKVENVALFVALATAYEK